jgi:hypothetical protein
MHIFVVLTQLRASFEHGRVQQIKVLLISIQPPVPFRKIIFYKYLIVQFRRNSPHVFARCVCDLWKDSFPGSWDIL